MIKVLEMFGEPITYGGQESVVYNMLSSKKYCDKFNIDLFTPYFADNINLIDLVEKNGGKVHSQGIVFETNDNRLKLQKTVEKFFKTNNTYDVVHIHSGSLTTMYVYAKIAKKYGIKNVIVHSHIARKNKNIIREIIRIIICFLLHNKVDYYLGCSKEAITTKFGNSLDNYYIINNGIDIEKFKFDKNIRNEMRNKYKIGDMIVIGSLGRISNQKNNVFMVDILSKLSQYNDNVVLLMVGDGEDLEKVKRKVSNSGLEKKVIFTGTQKETYKYYQMFDIFILPSIFEGLPVTSIEAQISGLPTLISDTITKECCISNLTKFLSINYTNLWVDEINNIIDNVNLDDLRQNAIIDFDKYDKTKTFIKVFDLYGSKTNK